MKYIIGIGALTLCLGFLYAVAIDNPTVAYKTIVVAFALVAGGLGLLVMSKKL